MSAKEPGISGFLLLLFLFGVERGHVSERRCALGGKYACCLVLGGNVGLRLVSENRTSGILALALVIHIEHHVLTRGILALTLIIHIEHRVLTSGILARTLIIHIEHRVFILSLVLSLILIINLKVLLE